MSSNVERKLAAIMFTDIAGYTSQMSKDQDIALSMLDEKRKVLKPLIQKHKGTLIKEMGDGTLSHFSSAIDATNCSLDLQKSLKDNNDLNIRVGVHLGDTSFRDNDVFGDGVNIASRLEKMSPPGGVLVSKNVYDELSSRKGYDGISLGLQSMKGVGRLIEVFGLKDEYLNSPQLADYQDTKVETHKDKEVPSIAIIPFDNKGLDKDAFYSYSISADLISECSSAGFIRVISLKEVEEIKHIPFKDKAKKLNVRYLVSGSLWRLEDIFQLSIELYDTKESKIIWTDNWQENWDNLQNIKPNLSEGILQFFKKPTNFHKCCETSITEAYEYYLKSKYKYETRQNFKDIEIAKKLAKKAIALDDNLLIAKNLIAWMHLEAYENNEKAIEMYTKHLKQAKNLSNHREMARSLNGLGASISYSNYGKDRAKAINYLKQSLEIRKKINDIGKAGGTLLNLGVVYFEQKKFNKALQYYNEAFDIFKKIDSKRSLEICFFNFGKLFGVTKKYKKSLKNYLNALEINKKINNKEKIGACYGDISILYGKMGDFDNSLNYGLKALEIKKIFNKKDRISSMLFNITLIYRYKGDYKNSLKTSLELYKLDSKIYKNDLDAISHSETEIGINYFYNKNYQKSIDVLLKSIDHHQDKNCCPLHILQEIYLNLAYKKLQKKFNIKNIPQIIKNEEYKSERIDYTVNYHLYELLEDSKYLKVSYNQIEEKLNNLKPNVKIKFLNCTIPKTIIEKYNKVFKK